MSGGGRAGATTIALFEGVTGTALIATKLCAWMSRVEDYKFLRVRQVDGQLRAVMRRTTGIGATYHELAFARSSDDDAVRIADVYSYFKGEWISDEMAGIVDAASKDPLDIAAAIKIQDANRLDERPAEALAALDELPPRMLALRSIQGWRVTLAQRISMTVYKQSLDELARRFPHDPSVALLQIDGALLRGDFTAALHFVDVVEATVGPDAFLDASRASVLAMRAEPGDLDQADIKLGLATRAEPKLPVCRMAHMAISLRRQQWTAAIADLDELLRLSVLRLADVERSPLFAEILKTPEYAAWRATSH